MKSRLFIMFGVYPEVVGRGGPKRDLFVMTGLSSSPSIGPHILEVVVT